MNIYLSPPDMSQAEREALVAAFDSGWVAPVGPDLADFEADMCAYLGLDKGSAVALSSGTAALHLGLRIASIRSGDEVWTSTLTFAATANAIAYEGGTPVFLDVDPATWQMDLTVLSTALQAAARQGRLPAALISVDLYGQTCDYERLQALCQDFGVYLIEDAAEALGATFDGAHAGTFGRSAAISFNGNKMITTGGGGMLLSRDRSITERARYLATQAREPVLHYEHTEIGYNYRLSNILAAIGRAQLGRLPELIIRRREIRDRYETSLCDVPGLEFMPAPVRGQPNNWLTCILLSPDSTVSPAEVCSELAARGIELRPLWKPMHLQPVFRGSPLLTRPDTGGSVAESLFSRGLCLPSGSNMTSSEQERVIKALRELLCAPPL